MKKSKNKKLKQVKGMKIEGKTALAMVLFVVSVFMVMLKFMHNCNFSFPARRQRFLSVYHIFRDARKGEN